MRKKTARFLFFLALIGFFILLSRFFQVDQQSYQQLLGQFPLWLSGTIFVVLCVTITTFVWVGPKDVFLIVAAAVYGPYISAVLVYIVEMISLPIFFLLARRLGREFVEQKLRGGIKKLDQTIAETSFWGIFFFRFFPVVPFRFLDLFMGLTKISLRKYFFIALVGSPLRVFFLQFFLSLGLETVLDVNKLSAYMEENPGILAGVFFYLLGAVVMMVLLRRTAVRSKRNPCSS